MQFLPPAILHRTSHLPPPPHTANVALLGPPFSGRDHPATQAKGATSGQTAAQIKTGEEYLRPVSTRTAKRAPLCTGEASVNRLWG